MQQGQALRHPQLMLDSKVNEGEEGHHRELWHPLVAVLPGVPSPLGQSGG